LGLVFRLVFKTNVRLLESQVCSIRTTFRQPTARTLPSAKPGTLTTFPYLQSPCTDCPRFLSKSARQR